MRSRSCIIAATLAAATLLLAQNPGNGKTSRRADRLIGVAGPAGSSSSAGPFLLIYNGGPVILGQTHIYYIWYGNWSVDPNAAPILNTFANNLTGSLYYNILTQYSQTPGGNISNSVVLSGSTNSTYVTANPLALTDSDISGIVQAAIGNNSLPLDVNGVYFVLTAPGVAETSGFLSTYCGWHNAFLLSDTWIQYAFVGDAAGPNLHKCAGQSSSSPNNDPSVDAMASLIAHELSEAVTDPLNNAWFDAGNQEIADKCIFNFGTTFTAPNGSMANVTLGGFDYLIQQLFSNASDSCVMSYQSTPDYSLSVSPGSQSAVQGGTTGNYTVTVNPTNGFSNGVTLSVTGLPAGATLNAPAPNPTSTTATFSISAGTAATGTYPLTITGTSGALIHTAGATLVVVKPDYSLSVSPGSRSAGPGTTTQSYTITVNPSNGFAGTVNFVVTGLPTGATLNPAPPSSSTSSIFAIAVGASAAGTYTLTITGTSGSLSHGVNATLVVNPGVSSGFPMRVGIFRSGFYWLEDVDGNQQFNQPPDQAFAFGGIAGDIPITGDWNGDGRTKVGIYRPSNGLFILDSNGDQQFDAGDAVYNLGVGTQAGDLPVVGDWNGDGRTKVGIFRQGFFWILDYNGNGVFEQGIDKTYAFGGQAGDVPVVGDWTGTGTSKIGVVRQGFFWILDANGNGTFDGTGPGQDFAFPFGGIAGDVPVVGDWNGDGTSKVGVFRQGFFWVLDANGNHQFDGTGPGQDLAFAFGGISGDVPVVGKWSSAILTATSGTPQTTPFNTAFAAPLTATLTSLGGSPLAGVLVTFAAPTSGASGTFAGGATTATATTNASGVATSPTFTANGTSGSYAVTASAPRVGTAANFSLTNTNPSFGTILVGSVSVGQSLQTPVAVTLSQSAGAGGATITVTSSDPSKLLVAGRPQDSGAASVTFNIIAGSSGATIFVQGVTSSGTATLTATTTATYNPGFGTITLTPSGFVLSSPYGIGVPSFSIGQGASTTLTVTVGRFDSSFNYVENQQLAPGVAASVAVTSSTTSVGTISTSPLTFSSGIGSLTTQFIAGAPGSTTLTAVVPSGFSTPASSLNTLTASVTAASLVPANVTVGNNLETTAKVGLNGVAPNGGLTVTISSNDTSLVLLAVNPTDAGSASIMLTIPAGLNHTPDFYVYGLAGGGLVRTYTASAAGFGSANGTVTLMPAGFILAGPGGIGVSSFLTSSASPPSTITVYAAQLDSSSNFVAVQQLRGGISANVNVVSGNTTVGTISTSPLTIAGGGFSATTQFQPLSVGSSALSVNVPVGFNTPAQDTAITATVNQPGLAVTGGLAIGATLETLGSVVIGQQAPAGGQTVLLTSNNPSQLKLAVLATDVGTSSIMVTIPAGSNSASFYLQAFGTPSAPTYTATATGFRSATGTIQVTASAAAIAGPFGSFPFSTTVASPPTNLTVSMIQLDNNGNFQSTQQLAGGLSLMVSLTDSNSAVATVPASVTIPGASAQTNAAFTPVSAGQATISVTTPAGYSVPPSGYGSVTGSVN